MTLTHAQLLTLKADIFARGIQAQPEQTIANTYNAIASPDFFVWRTQVTEDEVVSTPDSTGAFWNWPQYIARSIGEQNGWSRMFGINGFINPSLQNIRQGIADIFSGAQAAPTAQRTFLLNKAKRLATVAEKLFARNTLVHRFERSASRSCGKFPPARERRRILKWPSLNV